MPDLLVRNVSEDVVIALKAQAGKHGISAEAEHRLLLERALLKAQARSFAEVLTMMPNAGRDEDFNRADDDCGRSIDVPD